MGTVIPDSLHGEIPKRRTIRPVSASWGTGKAYGIVVRDNWQKANDWLESDEIFSYGVVIPDEWIAETTKPGETAGAPRLANVDVKPDKDSGFVFISLSFLAIDTGDETDGYAENTNARGIRKSAKHTDTIVHGIAKSRTSTGIPSRGDLLDGAVDETADAVTDRVCIDVNLDDTSQEGRVMVTSVYRAHIAGSVSERTS